MKAVVQDRYGPPEVLRIEDVERPVPKDDEVLIRVRATTVTTFMRGSRAGSPYAPNCVSRLAASTPVSSLSSRFAASSNVSVGRLKPPGIAHIPANGASPRRTSRTCSVPPDIVKMTMSTVTANAGKADGS